MSVKIMGLVWDLDLPQNQKFVLLAYADHADHDGKNIFPAVETIAKKTGYSARSVQRITRKLEELGYLVPDGGQDGGRGITPRWRIPKNGDILTPFQKGDILSKRVTSATQKGDIAVSPESSLTVSITVQDDSETEPETEIDPPEYTGPRKALRAWLAALEHLRRDMPRGAFREWVEPAALIAYDAGVFTIGAPNEYSAAWLESRLASVLTRFLTGAMAESVDLKFSAF